jgi:hypothetical protein
MIREFIIFAIFTRFNQKQFLADLALLVFIIFHLNFRAKIHQRRQKKCSRAWS